MADFAPELLTPNDAGKILGLSPSGVRLAAETGRLPIAARTLKGMRLFTRRDVEAFMAARKGGQRAAA